MNCKFPNTQETSDVAERVLVEALGSDVPGDEGHEFGMSLIYPVGATSPIAFRTPSA